MPIDAEGCKCGGSHFLDSMCTHCLLVVKKKYENKLEDYDEKVSEIETVLEQIDYCLYEEPFEER